MHASGLQSTSHSAVSPAGLPNAATPRSRTPPTPAARVSGTMQLRARRSSGRSLASVATALIPDVTCPSHYLTEGSCNTADGSRDLRAMLTVFATTAVEEGAASTLGILAVAVGGTAAVLGSIVGYSALRAVRIRPWVQHYFSAMSLPGLGLHRRLGLGYQPFEAQANRTQSRRSRARDPEETYLLLISGAEARSNRAFWACLVTGTLGALTVISGAAAGLLFGMPDAGFFTAVCGSLPTALAGLLGKMSVDANRDVKDYFVKLAESRELDREADRKIRIGNEIEDPGRRAAFLMGASDTSSTSPDDQQKARDAHPTDTQPPPPPPPPPRNEDDTQIDWRIPESDDPNDSEKGAKGGP